MHQLSYDFKNALFEVGSFEVSLQVHTFENVYGLDPNTVTYQREGNRSVFSAERLTWAGGQETAEGKAALIVEENHGEARMTAKAEHTRKIRCIKILISGLLADKVFSVWEGEQEISDEGRVFHYPDAWCDLVTPILFLKTGLDRFIYFRSLDNKVRAKRIAVYPSLYPKTEGLTVELIYEELAPKMSRVIESAPWVIGSADDPDKTMANHIDHVEKAFGLKPWEQRADVPQWAREIALIAYIHGQHWTGYIFNDYADMLKIITWLADRLEANRILVHVAGWEGRYYWQYGEYRPDPRMGGEEGFRRFAEGTKQLGSRIQLMIGANCANTNLDNFEQWGHSAYLRSAGGFVFQGNKPDWDTSRAHDHAWQAWLNPGCPTWRARLVEQVTQMVEKSNIDSIFLDTDQVWTNDPAFPVYEGLLQLRDELKARCPNLLIAGEGWYDALGAVTPLVHPGMPKRYPELLGKYCRCFAHNSWGDAGRGSTGVFEGGYTKFSMVPESRYWIPTAVFVEDTLDEGRENLEEIIEQAREYNRRYLHA